MVSGSYLAICLTELGRFDEAERAASAARETAEAAGSAFDRAQADLALAGVSLMRGNADHRIQLLEEALSLCRKASVAVLLPRATSALALAYALAGRFPEALALATERDEQSGEAIRAMSLLASAEALLLCHDWVAAAARAEALVQFARTTNQVGAEAWGMLVLASSHLACGLWQQAAVTAQGCHAIAMRQEMRPLGARATLVEALAERQGGASTVQARQHVEAAMQDCETNEVGAWGRHTLALLPEALPVRG